MEYPAQISDVIEEITPPTQASVAWIAVAVAALGYFVDVFDMWLFANFRVPSLTALGVSGSAITETGAFLINCQQVGFLLGGFVWGIMGDKRGRVSVMFGSILLYSIATLLNSFVTSVEQYAILRLLTGFGLAGEIGAGITLVSELLPRDKRGYGTTIVATLGVAGAIAAAYVGKIMLWKHAFILGGSMGLVLLLMRLAVYESGMYSAMPRTDNIRRGSLKTLFGNRSRIGRFVSCIILGIPIYLVFGLLITFSPEIGSALGMTERLSVPDVMIWGSIGITAGDLCSGLLSQKMRSRKRPIAIFLAIGFVLSLFLLSGCLSTARGYCITVGIIGTCTGYWACLITTIAEQFGTNLRATVTTSVPNLIRASSIPLNLAFVQLTSIGSPITAALWLTIIYFGLAFIGLLSLKETYGADLDYLEK